LRSIGIQPDIIVCRSERPLSEEIKRKIALFCDIDPEAVIPNCDAETIYEVPLLFEKEGLDEIVIRRLGLNAGQRDLMEWRSIVQRIKNPANTVRVGIVGKYVSLPDAYLSIAEALCHGGIANDARVEVEWISAEDVEAHGAAHCLEGLEAILVPGGFGDRGVEGKIETARYCRENGIPYFGICLGMQCAVIEFARNVCGLEGAHTSEIDPDTPHPVIDLMPEQQNVKNLGGTMRLGAYPCVLQEGTKARELYGQPVVKERHRHRYEVNNAYRDLLSQHGMIFSGLSPDERFVEVIELKDHPWFIACQFHPELKSRPNRPHPLFQGFVKAALEHQNRVKRGLYAR